MVVDRSVGGTDVWNGTVKLLFSWLVASSGAHNLDVGCLVFCGTRQSFTPVDAGSSKFCWLEDEPVVEPE
jgi:hypothetical protein